MSEVTSVSSWDEEEEVSFDSFPDDDAVRIIFCGGRDFSDELLVYATLADFDPDDIVVVHGAARGADRITGRLARKMGFRVEEYPAEWDRFGKRAGYLRNLQMASLPGVAHVIAFPGGVGTKMMTEIAEQRGIAVTEVTA